MKDITPEELKKDREEIIEATREFAGGIEDLKKALVAEVRKMSDSLAGMRFEVIEWIDPEITPPPHGGYYLVWVGSWEGYSDEDLFDVAYWRPPTTKMGSDSQTYEVAGGWDGLNAFANIEDGCPILAYARVRGPFR